MDYKKDFFWSIRNDDGKIQYFLKLNGKLISVDRDVYLTCMKSDKALDYSIHKEIERGYKSFDYANEMSKELTAIISVEYDYVSIVAKKEQISLMLSNLSKLKAEDKLLIQKIYFDGMTEMELAAEMNIPKRTLNNRKHAIFKKLKELMNKE